MTMAGFFKKTDWESGLVIINKAPGRCVPFIFRM
jgi:hypothetical protein